MVYRIIKRIIYHSPVHSFIHSPTHSLQVSYSRQPPNTLLSRGNCFGFGSSVSACEHSKDLRHAHRLARGITSDHPSPVLKRRHTSDIKPNRNCYVYYVQHADMRHGLTRRRGHTLGACPRLTHRSVEVGMWRGS